MAVATKKPRARRAPRTFAPHSTEERAARGKEAREHVPRRSHGAPMLDREDRDPVGIIEAQATSRVPELVPIRHGRMSVSAFTFYRGAAAIMAADLAETPNSGITVQLCGDAHASNFGIFTGPDRRMLFDVNDFDETHPGPWEWDVKRFVASLEIAGRDRGFKSRERRAVVLAGARRYREAMRGFAAAGDLDVWYSRLDVADAFTKLQSQVTAADVKAGRRTLAKARSKTSSRAIQKLTTRVDGRLRFISQPPLIDRLEDLVRGVAGYEDLQTAMVALLDGYRASLAPELQHLVSGYRLVDIARKVVGVGSVGTRAWVLLLEGRDENDAIVLQAKEAEASVLEAYLGASEYTHHGERVVRGQRFMQAAGDILLGWQTVKGLDEKNRDFYIRQLWDGKGSADMENMNADRMGVYAQICGWTLARAHARSGDRIAIAAYLGGGDAFDRAMLSFAEVYAAQNEADFEAFEQAIASGRLAATPGI